MENIIKKIKLYFITCSSFSIAVYISIFLFHKSGASFPIEGKVLRLTGVIFFTLTITSGIAGPIMLRAVLYNRMTKQKKLSQQEFISHNIKLTSLTLLTVLFSCVNYLLAVPELYLYGSVLAALYSIYGIMPADKKIQTEIKYYKVDRS